MPRGRLTGWLSAALCLLSVGLGAEPMRAGGGAPSSGAASPEAGIAALATGIEPARLNSAVLGKLSRYDFRLSVDGRLWLAYYGADGSLYVRRPDGGSLDLRPQDRRSAMSGLTVDASDGRFDLLWRDKLPRKGLYHAAVRADEGDVEPLLIDGEMDPLTRMEVKTDGGETLYLWYGEKPAPGGGRSYDYYFRRGEGNGGALSPIQPVMRGIYPTWIVDDERIAFFSYTLDAGRPVMTMRRFDRTERTFDDIRTIAEVPPIGPFLFAFRSRDRWFVLWVAHHGRDHKDLLLEGLRSDDQGATWEPFAFRDLQGLDFSHIDTAVDGKGNILIALSGAWRFRHPGARSDVYILSSRDNGATWSQPQTVRPAGARHANADHPSVTFAPDDGTAVLVWEDWRDIRSSVYASCSTDHGATWSERPLPLGSPGDGNLGLDFGVKAIRANGGRFHVVASRYTDDALELKNLVHFSFTVDQLIHSTAGDGVATRTDAAVAPVEPGEHHPESALATRVGEYWRAAEEGDHAATYAMLDPFFRARHPLETYRQGRETIRYHGHQINAIEMIGRIATVRVKVEASVPEFALSTGETIARPREEHSLTSTWLYIGDAWYREYTDGRSGTRFTPY